MVRLKGLHKQSFVTSLSAAVAALLIIVLITLSLFIFVRGSHYFWPPVVERITYSTGDSVEHTVFAYSTATTSRTNQALHHLSFSTERHPASRQITVLDQSIVARSNADMAAVVRLENGTTVIGTPIYLSDSANSRLDVSYFSVLRDEVTLLENQIGDIRTGELADIHNQLADMDRRDVDRLAPARIRLSDRFYRLQKQIDLLQQQQDKFKLWVSFANGQSVALRMADVVTFYNPNQLDTLEKIGFALFEVARFVSESPKLGNTSGGVFPALFGTIVMVLIMTMIVTPFGVMAALYLHEYAPKNKTTSLIRISVNNLAGVPSIVYGVFGLGFFVYTVGGNIDSLLFADHLPSPTFGTPGIFWASLTMAILTLPVVIVATEEGLRRVPSSLRDGSYALGATQAETITKMLLPIASPGIMTGIILAIARGAGEVAPLMLVGAVKFAPSLPVDGEFPFVHLQRQFMHLGVLIYDGAFHSQNIGNGSSFLFACCMLLLVVVLLLNLTAMWIRNRLRRRYSQN